MSKEGQRHGQTLQYIIIMSRDVLVSVNVLYFNKLILKSKIIAG